MAYNYPRAKTPEALARAKVNHIMKKFPFLQLLRNEHNILDASVQLVDDALLEKQGEFSVGRYDGTYTARIPIYLFATTNGETTRIARVGVDAALEERRKASRWWKPSTWVEASRTSTESVRECIERCGGSDVTHIALMMGTSSSREWGDELQLYKFSGNQTYGEWHRKRIAQLERAADKELEAV